MQAKTEKTVKQRSGLFIGLNKGFVVQKPKINTRAAKPSYTKGRLGMIPAAKE